MMKDSSVECSSAATPWPVRLFILCAMVAAIDGFDTQAIGYTGPLIAADLGFDPAKLGWVFSAGLLGAMLGAFLFGPLADRYGRGRMLKITCFLVAICTCSTLFARTFDQLLFCRFLTGIGLGGATPCFMGLGVEGIAPERRATVAAMLYATFPAGAVIGALATAPLLVSHGWRGIFLVGTVLPAIAGLLLLRFLPDPGIPMAAQRERIGVGALFVDGRAAQTLALWALFILGFSSIILLSFWMPALVQRLGVPVEQTGLLVACLNAGSVSMSLLVGLLIARVGLMWTLAPAFILGAASWSLVAMTHGSIGLLAISVTLAGAMIGGATTGLISIASVLYPSDIRATGIGWASGCARAGQMFAPPLIGGLVAASWSPQLILAICGIPLLIALLPLILLDHVMRTKHLDVVRRRARGH